MSLIKNARFPLFSSNGLTFAKNMQKATIVSGPPTVRVSFTVCNGFMYKYKT